MGFIDKLKWYVPIYLPWLIIILGGTISFAKIEHLQSAIKDQQVQIVTISNENNTFLSQTSKNLGKELLARCVEEFRIDDELRALSDSLLIDSAHIPEAYLGTQARKALFAFDVEIKRNQKELKCHNPSTFHALKRINLKDYPR